MLFCFTSQDQRRRLQKEVERYERVLQMNKRKSSACSERNVDVVHPDPDNESPDSDVGHPDPDHESPDLTVAGNSSDHSDKTAEVVEAAKAEVAILKGQMKLQDHNLTKLREEIDHIKATQLTLDTLQGNDKMVLFYTGLPNYETLKLVYDLALNVLATKCPHGNRKLDNFSECVLTLVKLRLKGIVT